jgi:hypothetical protein
VFRISLHIVKRVETHTALLKVSCNFGRWSLINDLQLAGPYTQRIRVPGYWPVNASETQRTNHSATMRFVFYARRQHQSIVFSLSPPSNGQKRVKMTRNEIRNQSLQLAKTWHALIGTDGIESRADLARHLGVSRASITQVLRRLRNDPAQVRNLEPSG